MGWTWWNPWSRWGREHHTRWAVLLAGYHFVSVGCHKKLRSTLWISMNSKKNIQFILVRFLLWSSLKQRNGLLVRYGADLRPVGLVSVGRGFIELWVFKLRWTGKKEEHYPLHLTCQVRVSSPSCPLPCLPPPRPSLVSRIMKIFLSYLKI